MKRTDVIIIAAGLLLGAGLAVLLYYGFNLGQGEVDQNATVEGANLPASPSIGSAAPGFTLQDLQAEEFSLHEMRGKIVVLNFWATWCAPCKFEMPFFEQLYTSGRPGLEIWGINFDEPPLQVENFVKELDLSFPILLDPGGKIQKLYRVRGYPTTYVIDEEGVIRFHHIGLITEQQLTDYLEQLGVPE